MRGGSAATLRTVVEMVRRIMRSDTASVVSLSISEHKVTWMAMSGFCSVAMNDDRHKITAPLRGPIAESAATTHQLMILEGIGERDDLSAEDFPIHAREGVRNIALVPLDVRGETLGALIVGYRSAYQLSDEEKQTLEGLADLTALALDNARLLDTVGSGKRIWEQTFDAIPDGIIIHDAAMLITRCNATAAEMMKLNEPANAIGMTCATAFARLFGERAAAFHMSQRAGTASSFEIQAEDSRRYLVSIAPLHEVEEGTGWSVITWSDVTELSEMQEQLSRSRRLATVGQLAAGVAHEINNPLAAITTCAEATLRDLRSEEETHKLATDHNWTFYLEEIVKQALRCKAITRGLLDLSRQRRARREACDLNLLVERSLLLFAQREDARALAFKMNLEEQLGEVATDEVMVRQILDNLLSNAFDALGGQGEITVSTVLHAERITIEVADTGAGIAPEMLVHIFDPFFTTKEAGKGSGLGLAISTTLAEALGGSITVESKVGAGSRFRLWLPRRAPEVRG